MKKAVFAVLAAVLPAGGTAFAEEHNDEGRDYSGPYIGISGGRTHNNQLCDHVVDRVDEAVDFSGFPDLTGARGDCENGAAAYKVFAGYDIGKYFGLEVGWADLGRTEATRRERDSDTQRTTTAELEMDAQTITAAALIRLPLSGSVQVFGKIGAHRWEMEAEGSARAINHIPGDDPNPPSIPNTTLGDLAIDDDGADLFYGVGISHLSGSGVGFRLEWERFRINLEPKGSAYTGADDIDDSMDLYSLGVFYHF